MGNEKDSEAFKKRYWQTGELIAIGTFAALIKISTMLLAIAGGCMNPVKRGYVDKPEHWRYSSGRDYIGLKGLVTVKPLV